MWTLTPQNPGTEHKVEFPFPSRFGYEQSYRTENAARTVACRSRHAFLPLIGELSMRFWYISILESSPGDWRARVCEIARIHPQWLTDLEQSVAGDLTVPRIGGIIDFSVPSDSRDPTYDVKLPRIFDVLLGKIIATNVPIPLYIGWGALTNTIDVFVPRTLEKLGFLPEPSELQYLSRLPGRVAFSRWDMQGENCKGELTLHSLRDSEPYRPSVDPGVPLPAHEPSPFPPVEAGSGQRSGESMAEFFIRRKQENVHRERRESPEQRQGRLQREAHAARGGVPGKKGARVYVWEKSNGHFVRMAGGRQRYDDIWEEYGPLQPRYDAFRDEWDVCDDFGPAAEDEDDDEDHQTPDVFAAPFSGEDDADDNDDVPSQLLPESSSESLQRLNNTRIPVTVPNDIPAPEAVDDVEFDCISTSFKEAVYMRYGCLVGKEDVTTPQDLPIPPTEIAKKFLGNPNIHLDKPQYLQNFCAFLGFCKNAKQLSDIPRPLLDFHGLEQDLYCDWVVQVRREVLNRKLHYVIYEDVSKDGLYILLDSATTTLEIVRQGWGPSLSDVIDKLLARNIQFLVCARYSKTSPGRQPIRKMHSGLGLRPQNYVPTADDYRSYVAIRDRFLQSPRGRAAKLYGVIVGRIACSVVSNEEVQRGPTDDVTIDGLCLWDESSSSAYWDDCLTEQEIDLICGVYHISTGQFNPSAPLGQQTTTRSWWPRPSAMANSGLSVGWCTPMCEQWYQRRLKDVEKPQPGNLVTHGAWKHNLKLERRCPPLAETAERVAAQISGIMQP
ncbi:hypothetical protein R3P38DRAFT_2808145 [Favolaschia claudopus]|uniref:Uncharacterized protein n=1 Tax=Favolaschia claudopus TaxID=2862362 RepID=A0AAV9ZGG8_9AGAR